LPVLGHRSLWIFVLLAGDQADPLERGERLLGLGEVADEEIDKPPETRTRLEAACDIRFELLGSVLAPLGKTGRMLELLGEAKQSAETLNDELRLGHTWSFMMRIHAMQMDLDDALVAGTRAPEIADRCGNLDLRVAATTALESVHFHRGEFERVVHAFELRLSACLRLRANPHCGPFLARQEPHRTRKA
jgi:hypothetical protein